MGASQPQPLIVRVVEQPVHQTGISDIVLGSIGLVGVLLIAAALLGLLLGGLLVGIKKLRERFGHQDPPDAQPMRVTPLS